MMNGEMDMKKLVLVVAILSMLMLSGILMTAANAAPVFPNLPTSSVNETVVAGTTTYLDITLSSVGTGFDVTSGTYSGWCADLDHNIDAGPTYVVVLESSLSASLPLYFTSTNWHEVNYVLNHEVGTDVNQIQEAIWYFTDGYNPPTTDANAWSMINSALANPNYTPGTGAMLAVLCIPTDYVSNAQTAFSAQTALIELKVPGTCGGHGSCGYYCGSHTCSDRCWQGCHNFIDSCRNRCNNDHFGCYSQNWGCGKSFSWSNWR